MLKNQIVFCVRNYEFFEAKFMLFKDYILYTKTEKIVYAKCLKIGLSN